MLPWTLAKKTKQTKKKNPYQAIFTLKHGYLSIPWVIQMFNPVQFVVNTYNFKYPQSTALLQYLAAKLLKCVTTLMVSLFPGLGSFAGGPLLSMLSTLLLLFSVPERLKAPVLNGRLSVSFFVHLLSFSLSIMQKNEG